MSVLIKGMEMPTSCGYCPLRHEARDGDECYLGASLTEYQKRPDDCPLVPVPPHGDLIDRDALMAEYERDEKAADEHGREFSFSFKSGGANCTEWWPVQQKLFYAPTIIPADPAEEGE